MPLLQIRAAALSRLQGHASTLALTTVASRPTSWPASNGYLLVTNFRQRGEEFVGLSAYNCSFYLMSFARAKKGATDPDVLALTNASLGHAALTDGVLSLTGSFAMVSLVPDGDGEGVPSEDDAFNYYTHAQPWNMRVDYTP